MELIVKFFDRWIITIWDDQLCRQKTQLLGKNNYKKMNNAFIPSKKIVLEIEANAVFFNFKKG